MKFQIDTNRKVIKLEEDVKLQELINTLDLMFPDNLWKNYTLETTSINFSGYHQQINLPYQNRPYYYESYPWFNPIVGGGGSGGGGSTIISNITATGGGSGGNFNSSGVYTINIENQP